MLVVRYVYNSFLFVIFIISKVASGSLSFVQLMLDITNGKTFKDELNAAAKKDVTTFIQAFFTGVMKAFYKDKPEVSVDDIVGQMSHELQKNLPGTIPGVDPMNPPGKS